MTNKSDEVREKLQHKTQNLMTAASDEIDAFGDALRKGAESMDDSNLSKPMLQSAADAIDSMADAADGKSVADATRDLSEFARRRPLAVYGAAALLGFAFARYASARPVDAPLDHGAYDDENLTPPVGQSTASNGAYMPNGQGAVS